MHGERTADVRNIKSGCPGKKTATMPPSEYRPVLRDFMNYIDNTTHDITHQYTTERLSQLTPADLMRYFNHRTFGTETPTDQDKPRIRSNTIFFWKKALSAYMPNRLMAWNELSNVGNPTRSSALNEFVKRIKKAEVRGVGAKSRARRALTNVEFREIMRLSRQGKNIIWKYGVPAQMTYQFHLIARLDDTMHVERENLDIHPSFDFALKTKLRWSKNVNEERDAPWQIVLESMEND